MRKIIDVSSYNGKVNWKKAKAYGCEGAILKIIRKDLTRDKQFNANYAACNANGIGWGVYNYSYATTVAKAQSDMKLVCDTLDKIDKKCFKYGIWFDIEDKVQAALSKAKIAEIINAAQKVVEARGYVFGVYTGMSYYQEHIDRKKVNCNNWWIARYYKGYDRMQIATNPNAKYKPSAVNVAWQYTSSGRFPSTVSTGNSGNFDLNVLYKDVKLPKKQPIKKTAQAKKSNTQIAKEVKAGKWGNGAARKKKLTAAGYNYAAIQEIVNKMYKK